MDKIMMTDALHRQLIEKHVFIHNVPLRRAGVGN